MAVQTAPTEQIQNSVQVRRYAFSTTDYHKMAEAGILGEDDPVELIDGEIRITSRYSIAHVSVDLRLGALFSPRVAKTAIVSIHNPVLLNNFSEPNPDLALLCYRDDFYRKNPVTAADVLLLIEISDTTLAYDRHEKLPRYALAGIPEVWITNVEGETIERYSEPQGNQYATKQTFKRGQTISVLALPQITVAVDDIFGPKESPKAS